MEPRKSVEQTDGQAPIEPTTGRTNHPLRIVVLMGTTQENLDAALKQLALFIETFYVNEKSGTALLKSVVEM